MNRDGKAEVRWVHVIGENNYHYLLIESDDPSLMSLLKLTQPPPLSISASRVRIPIIIPPPKQV